MLFFGDPFNGAPIKGYDGPRRTICNEGDLVCNGLPEIRPAHLDYERRTNEAATYLNGLQVAAAGVGDSTNSAATTPSATSDAGDAAATSMSSSENAAGMTSSSLASVSSMSRLMSTANAASLTSASMSSSLAATTSAAGSMSQASGMAASSAATSAAPAMTQASADSNEGGRIWSTKPLLAAILGVVAAVALFVDDAILA